MAWKRESNLDCIDEVDYTEERGTLLAKSQKSKSSKWKEDEDSPFKTIPKTDMDPEIGLSNSEKRKRYINNNKI